MTNTYLLDANALIALTLTDHEHHTRAAQWMAATVEHIAICPIVEGALVRFLVRLGQSHESANALLGALHADPHCKFWSDSISYCEADLNHVTGHKQVTDAYLASLAAHNNGLLATFDQALAAARPESVVLIP